MDRLEPSQPAAGFAHSVGADGEHVVAGAINDNRAVFFRRVGTDWVEVASVQGSGVTVEYQKFGWAAAIDGDRAVIGGLYFDPAGGGPGQAYVFIFNGSTWIEQEQLIPSGSADNDQFGRAVAIDGDRIVVGGVGEAYVFHWNGSSWIEEVHLTDPEGDVDGGFGIAVGISSSRVIVGDRRDSEIAGQSGAAHVYVRTGPSWVWEAKLTATDGAAGDVFGSAVAISAVVALVGAPGDDDFGTGSGSAYAFELVGPNWTQQDKLHGNDAQPGDDFGTTLAIQAGTALVGATGAGTSGSGAAYFFLKSGGSWQQAARFGPIGNERHGYSVAFGDGTGASAASAEVYVYAAPCIPTLASGALVALCIGLAVLGSVVLRRRLTAAGVSCLLPVFLPNAGFADPEPFEQVLVRFKSTASPQARSSLHAEAQAEVIREFDLLSNLVVVRVGAAEFQGALQEYANSSDVLDVDPDLDIQLTVTPNDPLYQYATLELIRAPDGWGICTGQADFKIAVLDAGIQLNHPDLVANIWSNETELNGTTDVDDDDNGYVDDFHGFNFTEDGEPNDVAYIGFEDHGVHVSGTIGAVGNNEVGIAGVN